MNSTAPVSSSQHRLAASAVPQPRPSVLAWPAWRRALAVTPALGVLWGAVAWALTQVPPL